ncbi:discoidin domain-containing protein [Lactococcus cremoris]|nr:discoidin domain-containing protein [Lactococcus cremoris]
MNALKRGKNINSTKFEIVPINKSGEAGHSVTTSIKWPDNSLPKAAFVAEKTVVKVGEQVTLINQSNLATTKYKWEIEGASPATSTEKNPQVSFAKAGTYSVKLTAINEKGQENTISQTALITVLEQPVELTNFALNQSVKVDSYTNESESGPKAVDGKLDTKWCAVGPSKHNIRIDLGKSEKINQVLIDHAQKGGESPDMNTSDYTIELSNDNQNWTEVVNVKKNKLGETKDSFKQTEARYVRITAIKPTQGADSAVRLYEIQVLGLKNS